MRSTVLPIIALLTISTAASLLVACVGAPTMVPANATAPGPVAPGRARVVFFRPSWEADAPPFARNAGASRQAAMAGTLVVDERGEVLGAVKPGTYVVADLEPGDHAFFAQDAQSIDDGCVTDCLGIGAARAHLEPGRTYGVLVEHPNRFTISGSFDTYRLDLLRADGAPLGRDGWTWLLAQDGARWARDHAARIRDIVQAGSERMTHPSEWDARASSIGP
jgi:hypothetical protein